MYESELQSEVSSAIIDGEVNDLTVAITDNENAVIVDIGHQDAAYTADDARELARDLKSVSDQRWEVDNDDLVEYIRDLADVVDGYKPAAEVRERWDTDEMDLA